MENELRQLVGDLVLQIALLRAQVKELSAQIEDVEKTTIDQDK